MRLAREGDLTADLTFTGAPGSPVGASLLAIDRSHALRGNAARDALRSTDDALIEPCATLMRGRNKKPCVKLVVGVHIHCCGNGGLWFRFYSDSLFQTPECRPSKKEPKGFAPAYGPLAGARGTFVTGPIRAQRLRFASLHLLPLCTTASYGRCAPTPGSIP